MEGCCLEHAIASGAEGGALSCLSQDVGYPVWLLERGLPSFKGGKVSGKGMGV